MTRALAILAALAFLLWEGVSAFFCGCEACDEDREVKEREADRDAEWSR